MTESLRWDESENWPYIGARRLHSFTARTAVAEDGTQFTREGDGWIVVEPRAVAMFCERRPYPGAGYHCLLDANHKSPHSDLTIAWDDDGNFVNADGSIIGPMWD